MWRYFFVTRPGIGLGSNFFPKIWPSHPLAVAWRQFGRATSLRRSIPITSQTVGSFPGQNKTPPQKGGIMFCDPAGDRTRDLLLKREPLYQLSYQVVFVIPDLIGDSET